MIRINLIRSEKKHEKKASVIEIAPNEMTKQLAFLAMFVVTIAACAFFWFDLSAKKADLESQVDAARVERDRLKSVKQLVDRLEVERNRLSQRLEVLTDLKNNTRTPLQPFFFIYLAHQENQSVVLYEVTETFGENLHTFRINGEASKEDLNRFSSTLMAEPLVQQVDIISQVGDRFQIIVKFVLFKNFGVEVVDEEEKDAA